jgi:hypothetical protein
VAGTALAGRLPHPSDCLLRPPQPAACLRILLLLLLLMMMLGGGCLRRTRQLQQGHCRPFEAAQRHILISKMPSRINSRSRRRPAATNPRLTALHSRHGGERVDHPPWSSRARLAAAVGWPCAAAGAPSAGAAAGWLLGNQLLDLLLERLLLGAACGAAFLCGQCLPIELLVVAAAGAGAETEAA